MTKNTSVLVVGAGPTGLTMAIEAKRLGLPVRLIDKAQHAAEYSQALVVQARTLEQFERYGIAYRAVTLGRKLEKASVISDGKTIVSFPFNRIPGRYPFVLFLPQSQTERMLTEHLGELNVKVERGLELVSVQSRDDGVAADLRSADGRIERVSARWLVGCDGAHSTIREQLGIAFEGNNVRLHFFLGDLELEGPDVLGDELRIYLHRGDIVFIGRLSEKVHRVIVALHGSQGKGDGNQTLSLADFQRPMEAAGAKLKVRSAEWMTPFHVNDRQAGHMRKRSAFLAGDASHVHSPVGGQGMNTGIQDVANLAWKLAAVSDCADTRLLDSYEEERAAVGRALIKNTSRVLGAASAENRAAESIRDLLLPLITKLPQAQDALLGFISETAIAYRHSAVVKDCGGPGSLRAGDRMPNPDVSVGGRLLDPLREARHLVIGLGTENQVEVQERIPNAQARFFEAEKDREVAEMLGGEGRFVVIRPDGYVGFRGSMENREELAQYIRLCGLSKIRVMNASD